MSLSRILGRNPSYIQQFMKRGSPRKLAEDDRRTLADHFRVAEEELGGPPRLAGSPTLANIPASSFSGPKPASLEDVTAVMEHHRLRPVTANGQVRLSRFTIADDTLAPDLLSGDEVIIDLGDGVAALRDGLYGLGIDNAPYVRRLTVLPLQQQVIASGNGSSSLSAATYSMASLPLLGRVIWMGRRFP